MIKLFRSTETDFSHNEWILNEAMLCKISEEINSDFTMELEYPLQDTKDLSKNLVDESIVQAPVQDDREDQRFRIIHTENTATTKIVQCQAKLLADLKENRVKAMTIVGKTRNEAIQYVLDNTLEKHNYKVGTIDNNTNRNVIVNIKEGNALSAIIGAENSILSEYGGEVIVDNDTICIVDKRGSESNTTIEYGKNIIGIKETTDLTNLATVLIPKIGDLRLPEYFVKSPLATSYSKLYCKELDIQGITVKDDKEDSNESTNNDNSITKEEAYIKMREACNKSFSLDHVDMINHNYEVDFISLRKTEEYKNAGLDALEDVQIGNTSIVKHKILNINLQGRINKYVYDVLLDNLETISFGFKKQDITNIINDTVRSIQFTKQEILLKVNNVQNTLSSQLKIAEEGIRTDVKNEIDKTNSYIEEKSNSIIASVSDLKNSSNTMLELLTNEINMKVNEEDFGLLLKASAREIAIAWNKISRYAKIDDNYGLILGDKDSGTYSKVGYDGKLSLMLKGNKHPLHCLSWTGSKDISCDDDGYTEKEIDLPSMFDGIDDDEISVSVSPQKVYKEGMYLRYWDGCYGEIRNGKLIINAMSAWRKIYYEDAGESGHWVKEIGDPVGGHIIVRFTVIA